MDGGGRACSSASLCALPAIERTLITSVLCFSPFLRSPAQMKSSLSPLRILTDPSVLKQGRFVLCSFHSDAVNERLWTSLSLHVSKSLMERWVDTVGKIPGVMAALLTAKCFLHCDDKTIASQRGKEMGSLIHS